MSPPTVDEALGQPPTTPWSAGLFSLTDAVSFNQTVTFHKYQRVVLPLDGYVFWVRTVLLGAGALYNAGAYNTFVYNGVLATTDDPYFVAQGSVHYQTTMRQEEGANYAVNRVLFTSKQPVQNLNAVGPDEMYIATFDGPQVDGPTGKTPIRYSFSERGSYYQQAGLHHYVGNAVYSFMASQIIDNPGQLPQELIVSNSLPAWLAFGQFTPDWPVPVKRPPIPIFPSFLVPDNRVPPYMAVHIEPVGTEGMQSAPYLSSETDHYQLARDRVTLTAYGLSNRVALDTLDAFLQYSYDVGAVGILNVPVVRDMKETQNELNVLAQKKTIYFEVSYNQATMRGLARQLIEECVPTVHGGTMPIPNDLITI